MKTKNQTTKTILALMFTAIFFYLPCKVKATVFTSIATGDWDAGSTWDQAGAVPQNSDDVVITGGFTVTITNHGDVVNSIQLGTDAVHGAGSLELGDDVTFAVTNAITVGSVTSAVAAGPGVLAITNNGGSGSLTCSSFVDGGGGSTYSLSYGAVEFTGSFTIPTDANTYNVLFIDAPGNTVTLSTGLTINSDLDIFAGTLDAGAFTTTLFGSFNNYGTFTCGASTIIFKAAFTGESINGTTLSTTTFYNLTVGDGSSHNSVSTFIDIVATHSLLVNVTSKLIPGSTNTVGGNGTGGLTGSGQIEVSMAGGHTDEITTQYTIPIDYTSLTVEYIGTDDQKMTAHIFDNLTINVSSNKMVLPTDNVTVNGNLVITGNFSNPTTLKLDGAHSLTVGGSIITVFAASTVSTQASHINLTGDMAGNGILDMTGDGTLTLGGSFSVLNFVSGANSIVIFDGNGSQQSIGAGVAGTLVFARLEIGTTSVPNAVANDGVIEIDRGLSGSGTLVFGDGATNTEIDMAGDITGSITLFPNPGGLFKLLGGSGNILTHTGTQTIAGAGLNFYDLVNQNANTILASPARVSDVLTFTSGKIVLGSNNLVISSGGSITGATSSNYVQTNGIGTLEMTVTTSGRIFPIGDDYNPVIVTPSSSTATYDVGVNNGVTDFFGNPISGDAVDATWTVSVIDVNQMVTVTPQWDASQQLSGFDPNNCYVSTRTWIIGAWVESAPPSATLTTNPYTQISGSIEIDQGSTYYVAVGDNVTPLPVTLLTFTAQYQQGDVNLNWITASEQNNAYFEVERSPDAATWTNIGQVPGHGTSNVQNSYADIDNLQGFVPSGTIYYRLKQVDFNGKYTYSEIRSVDISTSGISVKTYPNPVMSTLNFNWTSVDNSTKCKVTNAEGVVVYEENVIGTGDMNAKIDMSYYPDGVYFIQLFSGKNVYVNRIIKE